MVLFHSDVVLCVFSSVQSRIFLGFDVAEDMLDVLAPYNQVECCLKQDETVDVKCKIHNAPRVRSARLRGPCCFCLPRRSCLVASWYFLGTTIASPRCDIFRQHELKRIHLSRQCISTKGWTPAASFHSDSQAVSVLADVSFK